MPKKYSIAVHGGAGTIRRSDLDAERENSYREKLTEALVAGSGVLKKNGSALDAVEMAVRFLEDCPLFNAGRGSVFAHDGRQEMDAAIMCGRTLNAGAVALIPSVRNPVTLARRILEHSPHVFLAAEGALEFARSQGVELEASDYFFDQFRYDQWQSALRQNAIFIDHSSDKYGTVGAVALDRHGNLAAATSTGGVTNKRFGRIGDSPLVGSGTYANNLTCAVSCTGYGEYFIRGVVAYDLSCLMEYAGLNLNEAARKVIWEKQLALGGDGGLIAVDAQGGIVLEFNSEGMYRAWEQEGAAPQTAIFREG
ncbi:MAG: isoaspartyl peptidase/L-asparaginase [Saprospiraceae bacterium]|nr:isoaspartyl peptidase/L-asparaginase [Saprospiraceae bacterium]MCB0682119.1 isoaspartyl peptidase/L-asparaginase [Saprospiraceae bacterium]